MTAPAVLQAAVRLAVAGLSLAAVGCGGRRTGDGPPDAPPRPVAAGVTGEKLVAGALAAVSRLDDFDEQRAYDQAFDRLTQWSHLSRDRVGAWAIDPLVEGLPDRLATPVRGAVERDSFDAAGDVAHVRDRRWLADIASTARGDADDDLAVAARIFDWTIRSLAIVGDPPMVPSETTPGVRWFTPGEILLCGRASAAQRSWMFVEILRQAGIDAVMLATGDRAAGTLRPWLPAALIAGEAYLFEPTYGMPVPGPGGEGIATARQAAADPAILAALSTAERPYPVGADDVEAVALLVVADPRSLSRRMAALDRETASRHGVRLAVDATAEARKASAAVPGEDHPAGLWEFPWETAVRRQEPAVEAAVRRELAPLSVTFSESPGGDRRAVRLVRPLFSGRVREFRGEFDGPQGAKAAYLAARPSRGVIQQAVAAAPEQQSAAVDRLYRQMKEDATYWLGVLTLAEGQHEAAVDYLRRMTLDTAPDSRWTDAARGNLARALVPLGRIEEAVRALREDGSPQRFGSRLLADRLEREEAARPGGRTP